MFANMFAPVTTTCHKATMHKAAGSLTAAMQYHVYREHEGLGASFLHSSLVHKQNGSSSLLKD